MYQRILSMCALIFCVRGASAQGDRTGPDACADVLRYASKNVAASTYEFTVAKDIYEKVCSGEQISTSASSAFNLSFVVSAIPIGFGMSSGDDQTRISHFCKTYSNLYRNQGAGSSATSSVVVEALQFWSVCMRAAQAGVVVEPQISDTQVLFSISRRSSRNISVQGISYQANLLECFAPGDRVDGLVRADSRTQKLLTDDVWTIACNRKAQPTGRGNGERYPKANFTIVTTGGSFLLTIPQAELIPFEWASDMSSQLQRLTAEVDRLKSAKWRAKCLVAQRTSPRGRNHETLVEAKIPESPDRGEWAVTGGGCVIPSTEGANAPFGHNPPIPVSRPTKDGWLCQTNDPPGIALPLQITAYVVYCRNEME